MFEFWFRCITIVKQIICLKIYRKIEWFSLKKKVCIATYYIILSSIIWNIWVFKLWFERRYTKQLLKSEFEQMHYLRTMKLVRNFGKSLYILCVCIQSYMIDKRGSASNRRQSSIVLLLTWLLINNIHERLDF